MNILIVSSNNFPNGDAGALREETFAKMYKLLGYNVLVSGLGKSTGYKIKSYEEINFISLRNVYVNKISRLIDRLLYYRRLLKYVLKNNNFSYILIGSSSYGLFKKIKKYARRNSIVLIHDCVEWYSSKQFKLGSLSRTYIEKNLINKKLIDKNVKVISISTYLQSFFNNKGIKTLRIPVIFEMNSVKTSKVLLNDKKVILYAGMPGKKDNILEILFALSLLDNETLSVTEFWLVGITKEQLIGMCNANESIVNRLSKVIKFFGRLDHKDVVSLFKYVDFTIIFRNPNMRYSRAGFPSKVVESLAYSTPVICNFTSDLNMYLKDSYNSIISGQFSVDSLANSIKRALSFSKNDIYTLCENSRKTACDFFDISNYIHLLKDFTECSEVKNE